ncbi:MAG: RNA polymerase sigma factor [Oscillospiraceae bacterium]|nr:RNA polymerase sigma factor [Oscillospiraceae bacterium]
MNILEDEDIVNLYLSRNENAINVTKDKYGRKLKMLAYELTGDLTAAEECENDTYLQVWRSVPPNKPYNYLYPFLVRILRHIALNYCRDRKRLKRKASVEELDLELQQTIPANFDVEDSVSEAHLQDILNNYLRTLNPEKRRIFVRRYWYMDSIKDISEIYSISQSKVKVTLHRCRTELKTILESEGYTI